MSRSIDELTEVLTTILRRDGVDVVVDKARLAREMEWACLFYDGAKGAKPEVQPSKAEIETLRDTLSKTSILLDNAFGDHWLIDAIADVDTEHFGRPVERFRAVPGLLILETNIEYLNRVSAISLKISEIVSQLVDVVDAASAMLSELPKKRRGPAKAKQDLRAAINHLISYWEDVLGQELTVNFLPCTCDPKSAAAQFIVEAIKHIDPTPRLEDIRNIMTETRSIERKKN